MIDQRRSQFHATVIANDPLCRDHYRLVLRVSGFPPCRPGQFVQIACRDLSTTYTPDSEWDWNPARPTQPKGVELTGPLAFLRRPFSLGGRSDGPDGVDLMIIQRRVGTGTNWLVSVKKGDTVRLIGPLGNGFTLPAANQPAILVGGGVGIPPMLYLASQLAGHRAVAICGAVTRDLLPLTITADAPPPTADSFNPLNNIAEFTKHGVPAVICTDDGSYGFRGYVTQVLERYLEKRDMIGSVSTLDALAPDGAKECSPHRKMWVPRTTIPEPQRGERRIETEPIRPIIYTCGPEPMMKRVAEIATARGLACQVSVERAMACGMGTCQSCVIKVQKEASTAPDTSPEKDWVFKLACTDGPIFDATVLKW